MCKSCAKEGPHTIRSIANSIMFATDIYSFYGRGTILKGSGKYTDGIPYIDKMIDKKSGTSCLEQVTTVPDSKYNQGIKLTGYCWLQRYEINKREPHGLRYI